MVEPINLNKFRKAKARADKEQRAQENRSANPDRYRRQPRLIEGELIARSDGGHKSAYSAGQRVFHQKFGYGMIQSIDGNKLTIEFDKAGRKRVLDSFVEVH